jgi:adenylate cyclase
MADVFVSYARPDEPQAERVAEALRAQGYEVWRDDQLPAHRTYADVIEERLKSAKAVVALWSGDALTSQWVRAEADAARSARTLVQATLDGTLPPMPFNQIQCADLKGWDGDSSMPGWRKLVASVAALAGMPEEDSSHVRASARCVSVCVLPFANMSGDAEQEYFSDGISEDITTDLSKVSALEVIARNTAFQFKGRSVDVSDVAKKLGVSHVLEGSVRKAGNRVRITAQLIDGRTGGHVWADRYDRDLTDIFEIQDELSKAIVDALKIRLLPEEKKAIADRGTSNAEAYNLYLMARQQWVSGAYGNARRDQTIVRMCHRAVGLDPDYAEAWVLMAFAQSELSFWHGISADPKPAVERALALNPSLPEAMCLQARQLEFEGDRDKAGRQMEAALRADPESWEVNREAARLFIREKRIRDAIPLLEKAMSLMDTDFHSGDLLLMCYSGTDDEALRRVAERTLPRCETALSHDAMNGAALATGVAALLVLGQDERAREWVDRALLVDPDNLNMLYNLACPLARRGTDVDLALDLFEQYFGKLHSTIPLTHLEADRDIDMVRDLPRFRKMLAEVRQRLGVNPASPPAEGAAPPHS